MKFDKLKLSCTMLSPVHVGTGEEIAAYDYFIQSGILIKVNINKIINSLVDDELTEFNKLNDHGNYLGIRKFLTQKSQDRNWLANVTDFTIPVSKEVEDKYTENIDNPENQLLINLNERTPVINNPILPGSSIKGAIRTAVLSQLGLHHEKVPYKSQEAEAKILNTYKINRKNNRPYIDVGSDPFKYLKISDVQFPTGVTYICSVKNVAKDTNDNIKINEMQMIHEVFNSFVKGKEINFESIINLGKMRVGNLIIDKDFISKACKQFYNDKLRNSEFNYFQGTDIESNVIKIMQQINSNDEFLIRVGRFSGKESITLDKHRKGALPKTRNLAEGKYPMGWIKCKVIS